MDVVRLDTAIPVDALRRLTEPGWFPEHRLPLTTDATRAWCLSRAPIREDAPCRVKEWR